LAPDPHATDEAGDGYYITSIYFDTPTFAVYRREGSYGRAKFRIRRYGDSDGVFLERKLRTRSLVSKRRSLIALNEVSSLEADPKEIAPWAWFGRRLRIRGLTPVCNVSYHRAAHILPTAYGSCRITLDEGLRASPVAGLRFGSNGSGPTMLLPEAAILEMKFRLELPSLFKQVVAEFGLKPAKVSKYRLAVAGLGLFAEEPVQGSPCHGLHPEAAEDSPSPLRQG
jgi:hypothetical protein